MRVKTGKRILRVKGAQYTKVKTSHGRIGARNIPAYKYRKKKPPALRKPMAETAIWKAIRVGKAVRNALQKKKKTRPKRRTTLKLKDTLEPDRERPLLGRDRYNLVEFELNLKGNKYLRKLKEIDRLEYNRIVGALGGGLRHIHSNIRYVGRWLIGLSNFSGGKVPKDKGTLRRSLYKSLSTDYSVVPNVVALDHRNIELRIGFYSDLPYVEYLRKPFLHIKHHGFKRSRRSGIPLYDPGAKRNFMQEIQKDLRRVAMGNFYTMCRRVAMIANVPANDIKEMFTIKHIRGAKRTL